MKTNDVYNGVISSTTHRDISIVYTYIGIHVTRNTNIYGYYSTAVEAHLHNIYIFKSLVHFHYAVCNLKNYGINSLESLFAVIPEIEKVLCHLAGKIIMFI